MSDHLLPQEKLEEFRNTAFPLYDKERSNIDNTLIMLPDVLHEVIASGCTALWNTHPCFNQKIIEEVGEDDVRNRIQNLRQIDSYLRNYGTPNADESIQPLPKMLIRNALADIYQWFNKEDPIGNHSRSAIAKTMGIFGWSPELGPYTSDISSTSSPDNLPPREL